MLVASERLKGVKSLNYTAELLKHNVFMVSSEVYFKKIEIFIKISSLIFYFLRRRKTIHWKEK